MQFYFGNNQLSDIIQALKSIDSHGWWSEPCRFPVEGRRLPFPNWLCAV